MRKGYLHSVVWIVLTLVLALLCLYWLPDVTIAGWTMRKVDILADLRSDTTTVPDTVITLKPKVKIDSCKPGMTCINDFSDDETGMEPFYEALDNIGSLGRPVRIAVLGDSYIEGDILTADLRSLFQQRFGGCGVGYVPMSSETAGFRRSVRQYSSGWDTHNANDPTGYESTFATITGHYSYATGGASTTLNCVRYLPKLDSCDNTSLYFVARAGQGSGQRFHSTLFHALAEQRDTNGDCGRRSPHRARDVECGERIGAACVHRCVARRQPWRGC